MTLLTQILARVKFLQGLLRKQVGRRTKLRKPVLHSNKKFLALGFVCTLGLIGASSLLFSQNNLINHLNVLNGGLSTCFGRVNQSYTAKMIGRPNSQYLQDEFFTTTEDCFGDVLSYYFDHLTQQSTLPANQMNVLTTDVHWLLQAMREAAPAERVSEFLNNISTKFGKLELKIAKIEDDIGNTKISVEKVKSQSEIAALIFASVLFLCLLVALFYLRKAMRLGKTIERVASKQLNQGGPISSVKVEAMVVKALEILGLKTLQELFLRYHEDLIEGRLFAQKDQSEIQERVESSHYPDDGIVKSMLEETFQERPEEALPTYHADLDDCIWRVVDLNADALFSKGILIDVDVDQELGANIDEESLVQVMHNLLVTSINNLSPVIQAKRIQIRASQVNKTVLLEVSDSGVGYQESDIEAFSIENQNKLEQASMDLRICHELLQEVGGSLQINNSLNEQGEIDGSVVRMNLRASELPAQDFRLVKESNLESSQSYLRTVQKGTKKEIQKQIRREAQL